MKELMSMATKKINTEEKRRKMGTPAFVASLLVVGIVVIIGAFFVGKSDTGQINVAATIQNSNEKNGGEAAVGVVPEVFRNMPNGGLVPVENQNTTPPPQETVAPEGEATTTASTTEDGTETPPVEGEEVPTEEEGVVPATPSEEATAEEATPPVN